MSGLNFTSVLLLGFGCICLVMSSLIMCASLVHRKTAEKLQSWTGGGWHVIAEWSLANALANAFRWIDRYINHAVAVMILDYERSQIFGAIATSIFIIILPLAALANTLQGGSPFMLYCYGFICVGALYQLFTAESSLNTALRTAIAGISACLLVFALPYYAAWSLTEHLMNRGILISVLASVFVANVLYAGTAGLGALVRSGYKSDDAPQSERIIAYVLFAIPIYYVIYWLTLLAGHVAYDKAVTLHDWQSLLVSVTCGTVSFALIKTLFDGFRRKPGPVGVVFCIFAGAVILTVSAYLIYTYSFTPSDGLIEQGSLWLMHIPFVPFFLIFVFVLTSILIRILLSVPAFQRFISEMPLFASNLVLGVVGGLAICTGIWIQ